MPQCPTIQIRKRKLFASETHTLSMNIRTPSELVISRLPGGDCSWHSCISKIEGQGKFLSSRAEMGARIAIVLPLEGLGMHLESMSAQRLSSQGRCYIIYRNPWSFEAHRQSLSTVCFLKSDSLKVGSKRKMRFRWSVNNRKWLSLSRKCRILSSDSMIGMLPSQWYSSDVELHWMIHFKMPKARAPNHARWPSAASLEPELRWFPMKVTRICKLAHLIILLRMSQRDCVSDKLLDAAESSVMVSYPGDSMY